eukprot:1323660-Amphidinium_carterae.1
MHQDAFVEPMASIYSCNNIASPPAWDRDSSLVQRWGAGHKLISLDCFSALSMIEQVCSNTLARDVNPDLVPPM